LQVKWSWEKYKNSARADGVELWRWQERTVDSNGNILKDVPEDYGYAKYNKHIDLVTYSDTEYELFTDPNWTRQETDHLMELSQRFDLRFVVVADRWVASLLAHLHALGGTAAANLKTLPPAAQLAQIKSRSVEELKARYYGIVRTLLQHREGPDGSRNHHLVRNPYSMRDEQERKKALLSLFGRTPKEAQEEEEILAQAKAIEDRRRQELAQQAHLLDADGGGGAGGNGLGSGGSGGLGVAGRNVQIVTELFIPPGASSLVDPGLHFQWPAPGTGPILRGQHTLKVVQEIKAGLQGGRGMQKELEKALGETSMGIPSVIKNPTAAVCANYAALMREVVGMLEAKRRATGGGPGGTSAMGAGVSGGPARRALGRHD